MTPELNPQDLVHVAPLLFVTAWACLVLLASVLGSGHSRRLGALSALGILLAVGLCAWSWSAHAKPALHVFGGLLVVDRFALFIDIIVLLAGLFTVLVSNAYLEEHQLAREDFFALLLLCLSGMMMLVHAGSFVMLIIGLETMSLAVYALVACWSGKRVSAEAGIKYFVMGATASAFLLYGLALIYGTTGTTQLSVVAEKALVASASPLFWVGMYLVLGAMAFKVALVPFHMWVPDAYEGAPSPVTGFMAAAVKAAGFAALLRLTSVAFAAAPLSQGPGGWTQAFYLLSLLTMTVGNLAALRQHNIKRMLAYSSVAHAGYVLIGVVATAEQGESLGAVLYYLLAYAMTTVGAFAVVAWIGRRDKESLLLDSWAGVGARHPAVGLAMMLFLLSLAGVPPTAGFFAKFYLFRAVLEQPQLLPLVIVAALNSVAALYYYLRPIVAMYFRPEARTLQQPLAASSIHWTLMICAALVLLLGLLPGLPLHWAASSLIGL